MDTPFPPLSEALITTFKLTLEWSESSVSKIVLYQVLFKGEGLAALRALELLANLVHLHMSLETILGFEELPTRSHLAKEAFLILTAHCLIINLIKLFINLLLFSKI